MGVRFVSLSDLDSLTESAAGYRACCPVHGGKNATALSIDKTGEFAGCGYCFVCGRVVVRVKELCQDRNDYVSTPFDSHHQRLARQPQPKVAKVWQVEELQLLRSLDRRMRHALAWSPRARAYLDARGIPLWVAQQVGMGYLSRKVLNEPEYTTHVSLLYRWVDAVIFPLSSRVQGTHDESDSYIHGYIGRTLKLWRPEMDEDEHKRLLDGHNQEVRAYNEEAKARQTKRRSPILRWVKSKEPAGFFYPGTPFRVGKVAVLVEGGWDSAAVLSCLAQKNVPPADACLPSAGSIIGLAGTSAQPQQLPPQVEAVLLALDDDAAGLQRMLLLREDHIDAGRPSYMLSGGDAFGKDWSARWCRGGEVAIQPLFEAYNYVSTWLEDPYPSVACLVLVDELSDALALLSACAGETQRMTARQIVVMTSANYSCDWFRPHVQSVVFASGLDGLATGGQITSSDDSVQRVYRLLRERALRLRYELTFAGIRVYRCPPPADGLGSTWSERWRAYGRNGVGILLDAYAYAQSPLSRSA